MIPNAPRRRVLFVVVIALIGLMSMPIDECDDYAFLHLGAASAQAEVPAGDPDAPLHQPVCSCIVCVLTINEAFIPRVPTPQRSDLVTVISAVLCSSTFLPGIFRPPIA